MPRGVWEPPVEAVCPSCEKTFTFKKWSPRTYCSCSCSNRAANLRNGHWRGASNPAYKGGLTFDQVERRWRVICRDGTTEKYARVVMECFLRRPLHSDELVHHRNGDRTDDRLENLQVVTRVEHSHIHRDPKTGRLGSEVHA